MGKLNLPRSNPLLLKAFLAAPNDQTACPKARHADENYE
jgi:hypothetical protein